MGPPPTTETKIDADAFNAFEAAGWEKQAAGYEDFFGPITTRVVEPLLDAAEVGRGKRVLDVATGPGYVAAEAAGRGATAIGLDSSEAMLSIARQCHPQLEFHRGNVEALAFSDHSFDAVVGNFILLHLGRPEQAAAEFARVLEPAAASRSRSGTSPSGGGWSGCSSTRLRRQKRPRPSRSPSGRRFSASPTSRSSTASSAAGDSKESR
jgi:SAM-dependent methyltransferase